MSMKLLTDRLEKETAVLVRVTRTAGSTPREEGAWMAVFAQDVIGTVGGGHLEFDAIALSRDMLRREALAQERQYALGPGLGQCCGGQVLLHFERIGAEDLARLQPVLEPPRAPLALFGGGHVGRALVGALAPLPFAITWIDSRDEVFPPDVPEGVTCEHSEPVQDAVAPLVAGSRVLIMSFSHAEDLEIVAACLRRQRQTGDLPYIGLIGSQTKWASFRHRLEARGFTDHELARITCPIGIPGIVGKRPEVIAASVAAQILLMAPP